MKLRLTKDTVACGKKNYDNLQNWPSSIEFVHKFIINRFIITLTSYTDREPQLLQQSAVLPPSDLYPGARPTAPDLEETDTCTCRGPYTNVLYLIQAFSLHVYSVLTLFHISTQLQNYSKNKLLKIDLYNCTVLESGFLEVYRVFLIYLCFCWHLCLVLKWNKFWWIWWIFLFGKSESPSSFWYFSYQNWELIPELQICFYQKDH